MKKIHVDEKTVQLLQETMDKLGEIHKDLVYRVADLVNLQHCIYKEIQRIQEEIEECGQK